MLGGWSAAQRSAAHQGGRAGWQPEACHSLRLMHLCQWPASHLSLPSPAPLNPTHICLPCLLSPPPSPQRHWMTGSLTIPFRAADIGAAVPSNPPVLNRGVGPDVPAPTAPPPPPSPPPPPPSPPPGTCAPGATCCLNGVTYTSCRTDTRAGFSFTQLYKVAGGYLFVGIK